MAIQTALSNEEHRGSHLNYLLLALNNEYLRCDPIISMRVIALIESEEIVKRILKHLGLWEVKRKPMPVANGPPVDLLLAYDQPQAPTVDGYLTDPDYPAEAYF